MKEIHIHASAPYCVTVGDGALSLLGETAKRAVKGRTAMVVSETTVFPLYGAQAVSALEQAGFLKRSGIGYGRVQACALDHDGMLCAYSVKIVPGRKLIGRIFPF